MRAIDGDKIVKILNECIDKILAIQNLDITYNPKLSAELQVYKDMLEEINEMPTIEPEPHWIQCSERLPKIGDRVIGTYKNSLFKNGPYVVRIMRREKKYWVGDDEHWFLYENILAWQPLPEPYKEGDS